MLKYTHIHGMRLGQSLGPISVYPVVPLYHSIKMYAFHFQWIIAYVSVWKYFMEHIQSDSWIFVQMSFCEL